MLTVAECQYRSTINEQPVCQIVADITDRPLADCHVNDSACEYCLGCGIAPQTPNPATASMAIGVAMRTKDKAFFQQITNRVGQHLNKNKPAPTACVHRGDVIGQRECKPCQANGDALMVDLFRCPIHGACTLHATGTHPVVRGCAGCPDRQEVYQLTPTG